MTALGDDGDVFEIERCRLMATGEPWAFAKDFGNEIAAHWQRRLEAEPTMFDGVVHLMRTARSSTDAFEATLTRTDFKSYLFWREHGFPEAGVRDGFGAAVLCSAEGHVLLGRQRAGNVNGGLVYPPGGFIDARDVAADRSIDIEASIARELAEETGLHPADAERMPGYLVCSHGPQIAIAIVWRFAETSELLRRRILAHLAADRASELEEVVIARGLADVAANAVPAYARRLLRHVFGEWEKSAR